MSEPAYTRLQVDERRRQLLEAGERLFAEHSFEEISMRQIAQEAGVSKPLLYHYFPSKVDLFKAALAEQALELAAVIEPPAGGSPLEQLTASIDSYLRWIDENALQWRKLMESAATMAQARELVEGFRRRTMDLMLEQLTGASTPRPALRIAISGWLGCIDAAILDWTENRDLPRERLRDLLVTAFVAALGAAQQADPELELKLA